MERNQLKLASGAWLMVNCGNHSSEKNCKLVFLAPANQREELLNTVVEHAVKVHGHKQSPELKQQINQFLETVTV